MLTCSNMFIELTILNAYRFISLYFHHYIAIYLSERRWDKIPLNNS